MPPPKTHTTQHGTQTVKVFYNPSDPDYTKTDAQKQQQQVDRVALNRKMREDQSTTAYKIKAGAKTALGSAVTWAGERGREIAHETSTRANRVPIMGQDTAMGGFWGMPRDPFGVGNLGGGFGMAPEREESRPRRKPRRKQTPKSRSKPQPRQSPYPQMFGIPKHMRHLF